MKKKLSSTLMIASIGLSLTACSSVAEKPKEETSQASLAPQVSQAPHWSYEGESGPSNWSKLDSSFAACTNGTEQSPVDIELSQVKLDKTLEEIKINYKSTMFTLMNNGHTIQINDPSGANSIIVEGKEYKLVQMQLS